MRSQRCNDYGMQNVSTVPQNTEYIISCPIVSLLQNIKIHNCVCLTDPVFGGGVCTYATLVLLFSFAEGYF